MLICLMMVNPFFDNPGLTEQELSKLDKF